MQRRGGLGRGLSALLPEEQRPDGVRRVSVHQIDPNPGQPRRMFHQEGLSELAESLRQFGVLVPLLARRQGDRYELIAGERRLRAAKLAGLEDVPVLVRDVDDRESVEVAVVENLQRENLDPLEEAMGFSHLIERHAYTQERLAERLGKSRPAVANALRLLDLPDSVKRFVHDGRLSAGQARAVLGVPEAQRVSLAERVVREGLTVRAIEKIAQDVRPPRVRARIKNADLQDFENRLRYRFAVPVAVERRGNSGKIELRFSSEDDFMRIADLLLPAE
jgi:ParB family chromosome partitioning protein